MGKLTSSESAIICKDLTKPIHQLISAAACLICKELTKPIHQLTSATTCLIAVNPLNLSNSWHQQLPVSFAKNSLNLSNSWHQQLHSRSITILVERIFFAIVTAGQGTHRYFLRYYHDTFLSFCYCPPPQKQLMSFADLSVIDLIFLIHKHRETILLEKEA